MSSYNVTKLGHAVIPLITVVGSTLGALAFFAYLAGLTSTLGALIAGTNSQARLVFNAGREGLLPVAVVTVYTLVLNRRDSGLAGRAGPLVADE